MTSNKYWTKQEDSIISNHYTEGLSVLQEKLPYRSEQAIRARIKKLNYKMPYQNFVVERIFAVRF